jgi:NAD(P)-dependent dehydrogenase (short-subunit alcohol dehydrogenase family)
MSINTLIVGGTRGLGKAVFSLLTQQGHQVSLLARNKSEEESHNINFVAADLLQPESYLGKLTEMIHHNGKLNHLIFMQRYRGSHDNWEGELEVSLHATRNIIEHIKNHFHGQNASIVIVSSMAGKFATESQPLSYAVAKAGLNQIVQHYAVSLGEKNIRVNAVSPCSFIKEESRHYYDDNKALSNLYCQISPLKRMCQAEDVANVISFLCSQQSSFITGQNIVVDGGLSIINHESLARTVGSV